MLRVFVLVLLIVGSSCENGKKLVDVSQRANLQPLSPFCNIGQEKTGSGSAVLQGKVFRSFENDYKPERGITVLALNYDDYSDTVAVTFSDSLGTFLLEGLPRERIDVIMCSEGLFPRKWSPIQIGQGVNTLEGVLDGAVLLNGLNASYNPQRVNIEFKSGIPRGDIENIIDEELLTIQLESEGTFSLLIPSGLTVSQVVDRLIRRQEVKIIEPSYLLSAF